MDKKTYQEHTAWIEAKYEAGPITCKTIHPQVTEFINEEVEYPELSMVIGADRLSQQIAICIANDMRVELGLDSQVIGAFIHMAIVVYQRIRESLPEDTDLTPLGLDEMYSVLSEDGTRFLTHEEIFELLRSGKPFKTYEPEPAKVLRRRAKTPLSEILAEFLGSLGDPESPLPTRDGDDSPGDLLQ